jgi:hypothetical protein
MKKSLIGLTALAGLLVVGCSSNRGGTYDEQQQPGYNTGTSENPNPDTAPYPSGGPVRGPGTGGMGDTNTTPYYDNTAPSSPDNDSQSPR